jgi:hypothetical protein
MNTSPNLRPRALSGTVERRVDHLIIHTIDGASVRNFWVQKPEVADLQEVAEDLTGQPSVRNFEKWLKKRV